MLKTTVICNTNVMRQICTCLNSSETDSLPVCNNSRTRDNNSHISLFKIYYRVALLGTLNQYTTSGSNLSLLQSDRNAQCEVTLNIVWEQGMESGLCVDVTPANAVLTTPN